MKAQNIELIMRLLITQSQMAQRLIDELKRTKSSRDGRDWKVALADYETRRLIADDAIGEIAAIERNS